jgi:hypothetical protein
MKVKGLDGKDHNMDIRPSQHPMRTREASKSNIQYECGQLIKNKFPLDVILEEIPIPGLKLYIDFFLPTKKLAFEIQGKQHSKYSEFFHGSMKGFKRSLERDKNKAEWCRINSITLVTVDSLEELSQVLNGAANE